VQVYWCVADDAVVAICASVVCWCVLHTVISRLVIWITTLTSDLIDYYSIAAWCHVGSPLLQPAQIDMTIVDVPLNIIQSVSQSSQSAAATCNNLSLTDQTAIIDIIKAVAICV